MTEKELRDADRKKKELGERIHKHNEQRIYYLVIDGYKELTGFVTREEFAAYQKGQAHMQKALMDYIEKWKGRTNSELGRLLEQKSKEYANGFSS